ncbi:MAG: rod shape-determining protein MreD [Chloroflexota bacterium]|jgi:rod shape-determining protein MreD|nr:rod shape-determining protein MreD [Chloroflexota bacterium]
MRLTLAAVGAVVAALLQLTIVPYLRVASAQPDLVLVFAVTATIAGTVEAGLLSAFIGGLMIDLLAPRPLGMTAFILILSVGLAVILGHALERIRPIVPIVAVFLGSCLSTALFLFLYGALRDRIPVTDPVQATLPNAIYSTAVAAVIGTLAVAIRQRAAERERIAW